MQFVKKILVPRRLFQLVTVFQIVIAGCILLSGVQYTCAGSALLKNGIRVEGKPIPIQDLTKKLVSQKNGPLKTYPILSIDTGMKRYFVPSRQVQSIDRTVELSHFDQFKINQRRVGRSITISSLGPFVKRTEFDKYGRRTVYVRTSKGVKPIVQGITIIDPRYLTLTGITHVWEHGIATTSMPPKNLDMIIRHVTDQEKSADRMAIARFYYQAGLYVPAEKELKAIRIKFPELKAQIEKIEFDLFEQQAKELIRELHRRKKAGQHQLAYSASKLFPSKRMSAGVLREVRDLKTEFMKKRDQIEQATSLLGEFQSQLKDEKQKQAVMPLRSEITNGLNFESLERLQSFLNLSTDNKLSPAEKLALAYSGWVLGSSNAVTDLDKAIHFWQARYLMIEYMGTDIPQKRSELLAKLIKLEGIDATAVINLIPLLPPPKETPNIQSGVAKEITIPKTATRPEVKYHVLLPQEYSPYHSYPMIVSLRPVGRNCQSELKWWGGTFTQPLQSQRRGYIVIAPEYLNDKQGEYSYSAEEHQKILAAIHDAKQRFIVNSDRVFLAGHGIGGDAACDIGMSHPGLFAGIIPICGQFQKYTKYYWKNTIHVPWYVVGGEIDRNTLHLNARDMSRMMRYGYDIIYCEYIGRGYESYYAEIHKLFDWMEIQKRTTDPLEISAASLRPGDNRFYWFEFHGLTRRATESDVLGTGRKRKVSPMKIEVHLKQANSIYIQMGGKMNIIWLNQSMIDFDKRLTVRKSGRTRFNNFPEASIETVLEDFQKRADRQKVYSMKVVID